MSGEIPRIIIWLILTLAHLPLVLWLRRSAGRLGGAERAGRMAIAFGGLTIAWGGVGALSAFSPFAGFIFTGLAPALVGHVIALEYAFNGATGGRRWLVGGAVWSALAIIAGLGSHGVGAGAAIVGWAVLWVAHILLWTRRYAQATWAFRRNRALYWVLAALLLAVGQALALFGVWQVGVVGLLVHLGGWGAIVHAIPRRDLPNVRAALRQGFTFALLTLAIAAVMGMSLWIISQRLSARPLSTPVILVTVVIVAAGLTLVYDPLRKLITRLAEQLMPGAGYNLDEKLREYSQAISNVIDLDQLAVAAAGALSAVLDTDRAALILVTEGGHAVRLRPLQGVGEIAGEEISFDVQNPLVAYMYDQQKPVFQHNLEQDTVFRNLFPKVRDWLRQMGMEVYVPIFAQSSLLGILAVGPPRSGEPFGAREQAFLAALAHQTAVVLRNARMFEDMRALNAEITQLNEELRRAKERAERLDRAKTDFLAVASHELRTPLTYVRGYADLLVELSESRAITAGQTKDVAGSISRATERLETIVKAVVDMAQLESGKLDVIFGPTTLQAVMRQAIAPWLEPLQRRKLCFSVQGVDGVPPILADLQRLAQAFSNLISNAIKYTPDGGSITIRAGQIDDEYFKVVVSDTGVGIDPADQEIIFDHFTSIEDPARHSSGEFKFMGGGPGLGLAIARGVIEAHGGRIWVVSEGRDEARCPGSEFHVVLPLEAHTPPLASVPPFTVPPAAL